MIQNEMRRDDEPTSPNLGSALDTAVNMLNRYLLDMQHEWDELAAALNQLDGALIETAAKSIVVAWKGACAASERIEARAVEAQARYLAARYALRTHSRALGDLFQRAMRKTQSDTALHAMLHRLSTEVRLPTPDHNSGTGVASSAGNRTHRQDTINDAGDLDQGRDGE